VLGEFSGDVRMVGRTLEDEVLQEVGHPGFAVGLVAGAYFIGYVDGDVGDGIVREEQDFEAVLEFVFGDALHGGYLFGHRLGGKDPAGHNNGQGRK